MDGLINTSDEANCLNLWVPTPVLVKWIGLLTGMTHCQSVNSDKQQGIKKKLVGTCSAVICSISVKEILRIGPRAASRHRLAMSDPEYPVQKK